MKDDPKRITRFLDTLRELLDEHGIENHELVAILVDGLAFIAIEEKNQKEFTETIFIMYKERVEAYTKALK